MKPGDLMETVIRKIPVVLIRKESKNVWLVLGPDGKPSVQWTLNLTPIESSRK